MLDTGHLVDRLLDPLGELALDGFRRCTGKGCHHGDHREFNIGEHFHRQAAVGEYAHDHQGQNHDGGEDGAFYREVGENHPGMFPLSYPGRTGTKMLFKIMNLIKQSFCFCRYPPLSLLSLLNKGLLLTSKAFFTGIKKDKGG